MTVKELRGILDEVPEDAVVKMLAWDSEFEDWEILDINQFGSSLQVLCVACSQD